MPRFKIIWSTPHGNETEIVDHQSEQGAENDAVERSEEAWSDKVYGIAEAVDDEGEGEE